MVLLYSDREKIKNNKRSKAKGYSVYRSTNIAHGRKFSAQCGSEKNFWELMMKATKDNPHCLALYYKYIMFKWLSMYVFALHA